MAWQGLESNGANLQVYIEICKFKTTSKSIVSLTSWSWGGELLVLQWLLQVIFSDEGCND